MHGSLTRLPPAFIIITINWTLSLLPQICSGRWQWSLQIQSNISVKIQNCKLYCYCDSYRIYVYYFVITATRDQCISTTRVDQKKNLYIYFCNPLCENGSQDLGHFGNLLEKNHHVLLPSLITRFLSMYTFSLKINCCKSVYPVKIFLVGQQHTLIVIMIIHLSPARTYCIVLEY